MTTAAKTYCSLKQIIFNMVQRNFLHLRKFPWKSGTVSNFTQLSFQILRSSPFFKFPLIFLWTSKFSLNLFPKVLETYSKILWTFSWNLSSIPKSFRDPLRKVSARPRMWLPASPVDYTVYEVSVPLWHKPGKLFATQKDPLLVHRMVV